MSDRRRTVTLVHTAFENAPVGKRRNREVYNVCEHFAGVVRCSQPLTRGCKKFLPSLEILSHGDVAEYNRVDHPVCLPDLRDRRFSGKLFAALSESGNAATLAHAPRLDLGASEARDLLLVVSAVPLRNQHLDPLADDLLRRPAENLLGPLIEKGDALPLIHADHRIGGDSNDLGEYFVGYAIGHLWL